MVIAQKLFATGIADHLDEKLLGNSVIQKPLPVLAEAGMIKAVFDHIHIKEPTE